MRAVSILVMALIGLNANAATLRYTFVGTLADATPITGFVDLNNPVASSNNASNVSNFQFTIGATVIEPPAMMNSSVNLFLNGALEFNTGAGEARLDLTDLRVTNLRLQTGASSTDVTMPANAGHTKAKIDAGAASITIRIPSGVAARISSEE